MLIVRILTINSVSLLSLVISFFFSPILLIAEYRSDIHFTDGTSLEQCLTEASNIWTIIFFIMIISLFFILPLIILIVLYTIIAKNLMINDHTMEKMRPSKPELGYKARKQVVFMLGAVVISFFICLMPFRILTLWIVLAPNDNVRRLTVDFYYNLLYFCRIMHYFNSAVNPILYNLMSSKFRKGFQMIWCCCWTKLRKEAYRNRAATFNTTTTTTTSSLLAHSLNRKASSNITVSMDDVRSEPNLTISHELELWSHLKNDLIQTENFPENSKKLVEYSTLTINNDLQVNKKIQCKRQVSYDETILRKKKILLQFSYDEQKTFL